MKFVYGILHEQTTKSVLEFLFTPYFYEQWLQKFPGAESHFFPDAGHYVLEDAFDQLAPLIINFFQNQQSNES